MSKKQAGHDKNLKDIAVKWRKNFSGSDFLRGFVLNDHQYRDDSDKRFFFLQTLENAEQSVFSQLFFLRLIIRAYEIFA